jgi:deazaflavin-dependent oxidoreductase (nitroreductase family)
MDSLAHLPPNLPLGNNPGVTSVRELMNTALRDALNRGGIADITTTGRKTGLPRRIEIYFHQFDGRYYLTGRPGVKRDWEANIEANPEFTLHLKRGITADVPVVGDPEPDRVERARILYRALTESWGSEPDRVRASLDRWVDTAPFIRFQPVDEG